MPHRQVSRRSLLKAMAAATVLSALPGHARASRSELLKRAVPATGERIPVIGMGSWQTFDIRSETALANGVEVLEAFFSGGGRVIDSSPMYGEAEAALGHCLEELDAPEDLFAATKVWTRGRKDGIEQMLHSAELWDIPRFDLMQIHNLVDWRTHLETLLEWKKQGRIRYLGITTSHGSRHREFLEIMRSQPIDFVQYTYNIGQRKAEEELLPLAQERGIAVIINRPFGGGGLFRASRGKPLPAVAAETGCESWAQLFLKFVVSHPAVACAIPATSSVAHMRDNMGACRGPMPTPHQRRAILRAFEDL